MRGGSPADARQKEKKKETAPKAKKAKTAAQLIAETKLINGLIDDVEQQVKLVMTPVSEKGIRDAAYELGRMHDKMQKRLERVMDDAKKFFGKF